MFNHEPRRRRVLKGIAATAGAALAAPLMSEATSTHSQVVATSLGKVRGTRAEGISAFKGIPYGADTSASRFSAPQSAQSWSGVRDATRYGPRAPQAARDIHPLANSWIDESAPHSEDCLVLNLWTPATDDAAQRPVMVWLHGGGFSSGSGGNVVNDGARLARRGDVVVITLNHRLNVFGYLYLAELGGDEFADSGTAGLLDVALALQWIRDNASAFGGDPANVTLFGESGGGAKISMLLGMPAAQGLFHKAIIQSGAYLTGMSRIKATAAAERYIHELGLSRKQLSDIRSVSMESLVDALGSASTMAQRIAFAPVTDGSALPRDPYEPDATALSEEIPVIVGNTRWEYIYQYGQEDAAYFELTFDTLTQRLSNAFTALAIPADAQDTISHYRRFYPQMSASDIFFLAISDGRMLVKSLLFAERKRAQAAPVYMYMIEWLTPMGGGKWRSPHAVDVPLVFDNIAYGRSMTGEGDEQNKLAAQMSEAWIAFARSGAPQTPLLPHWPSYDAPSRATMIFDAQSRIESDPAPEKRLYWSPKMLGG